MAKLNIDLTSLLISREKTAVFFKEKLLSFFIKAGFFLIGFQLLFIALLWRFIPPQIPLFYSLPWGEEQLADKSWFFLIPFSLILFQVVNFYLAMVFFPKEKLLAKTIAAANFVMEILFTITMIEIIFITAL